MSSSSGSGKCPLCLKVMLIKNFKRHCDNCHDSVNTKEKYEKLLLKMKETVRVGCPNSITFFEFFQYKRCISTSGHPLEIIF